MSILGRVGALLKSELSGRWHVRRWGGRRDARPDQQRTAGDTDARPEATEGRGPRVPVQDPVQDPVLARAYANLELPYGADLDAVRQARRRLLRRYHPDLHAADPERKQTATRLAQGLNGAHDELVKRLDRKQR
jgi:DnaJ-domain-containing protein 1